MASAPFFSWALELLIPTLIAAFYLLPSGLSDCADLPECLRERVRVVGTRAFQRAYVPHPDDVVAVTKKYLSDKAVFG